MKVLLINGSPRKQGNTHLALQEVAKQLEKEGVESELVWIGNKPVHGCIACYKCVGGDHRCVFNDDLCNEVIAKMADCDGLIVGSPVYWGQPTGALLSLQQRMLFAAKPNFVGKPCGSRLPLSARRSHCRFPNTADAFPDAEHADSHLPILEHRLWA